MKLSEYIEDMGISVAKLTRISGLTKRSIYNLMNEKRDIRLSTAVKIERATKGKVTCREIYEEYIEKI